MHCLITKETTTNSSILNDRLEHRLVNDEAHK